MSQPEGKGSGALEVKFVPDEEVLKHITDDAGTAGPGQRPARRRPLLPGRWERVPGSRRAPREGSPPPTPGAAERLGRAAGRTRGLRRHSPPAASSAIYFCLRPGTWKGAAAAPRQVPSAEGVVDSSSPNSNVCVAASGRGHK